MEGWRGEGVAIMCEQKKAYLNRPQQPQTHALLAW